MPTLLATNRTNAAQVPRFKSRVPTVVLLLQLLFLVSSGAGQTVSLAPGDIVAIDVNADPGGLGAVIKVDANTGTQTVLSSGGSFYNPFRAAVDASGQVLVVDTDALSGNRGGIIRVDPTTGTQTVVSSGGYFDNPAGIAIEPDGNILVAEGGAAGLPGLVIRVDPTTGAQTVVSSGGYFVEPADLATEATGSIVLPDYDAFDRLGAVIRVDPDTGTQTVVSVGGYFSYPIGITVEASGTILVVDFDAFGGSGGVIRVNPTNGAQSIVSEGDYFVEPKGIALEADGSILVADQFAFGGSGGIIRVNPTTGTQAVVSAGGNFAGGPRGVAVVPITPPLTVAIDIKPGSFPNSINLGSGGSVPVAILSSATFDAAEVAPSTVTLASAPVRLAGKGNLMSALQDVDNDGLLDLVVHVDTEALQLSETDVTATVNGMTFDGLSIVGTDSVRVVP